MKKIHLTFALLIMATSPALAAEKSFVDKTKDVAQAAASKTKDVALATAQATQKIARITADRVAESGKDIHLTSASAALGGTEEGASVGAQAEFESRDGSTAFIEGTAGGPLLRIRGKMEAIPLKLIQKDIPFRNGSNIDFDLTFAPATAEGQLSLSRHNPDLSHIVISPTLAAQLKLSKKQDPRSAAGIVRLHAAPATGVAHDGDGTAFVLGARVGVQAGIQMTDYQDDKLEALLGIDRFVSALSNMDDSTNGKFSARVSSPIGNGKRIITGFELSVSSMDVAKADPVAEEKDNRETVMGVVSAGVQF